jgi:hypothetical protein
MKREATARGEEKEREDREEVERDEESKEEELMKSEEENNRGNNLAAERGQQQQQQQQQQRKAYSTSWTTQHQRALFTDQLLLLAIREICLTYIHYHYPFSYRHGRDKTLARSQESQNREQVR